MYIVNIWQSYDHDSPAIVFDTAEEATRYLESDFLNELRIAEEENNSPPNYSEISADRTYAQIYYRDGSMIAWTLATVTDMRKNKEV